MIHSQGKRIRAFSVLLCTAVACLIACSHERAIEKRISFPTLSWQRYNILLFEFPVSGNGKSYDLLFELRCKKTFVYDELPFNMVLNNPSGEERIMEYMMTIKDKNGSFTGTCNGDTCIARLFLKKNLLCSRKGVLKVEIENLNPRMETEGIFSASLVLMQH